MSTLQLPQNLQAVSSESESVRYSNLELVELTADDVLVGLLDHGLFGDKIPPCFSSKGLASIADKSMSNLLDISNQKKTQKAIEGCVHDYIRYSALRDINIPRPIGIPHPESYAIQALAIRQHWAQIQAHLQKPSPQVSRVRIRHVGGGRIFEMNYKGEERFELEEIEIGWKTGAAFLVTADISLCFASIYTHSIPWALHTRDIAKKKRGTQDLPGNMIDKCTQAVRDGQTNGLLIGPHSSNLISEIILSEVDAVLLGKGYKKLKRFVDDYEFFADSYDEALRFQKDLSLALRDYELTINEKKTQIHPLPRPSRENWVRELNRFALPEQVIRFSTVREFLDLALELAQQAGTSATINYAIKMIPKRLNERAKRLYVAEAINLAITYPYLASIMDQNVFVRFNHVDIRPQIATFVDTLIRIGIQKVHPDSVVHAIFLALKYEIELEIVRERWNEILELDDCLTTVLLLEYATKNQLTSVSSGIKKRSLSLKSSDPRETDRQWLLAYQTWSVADLKGKGQRFLADLREQGFVFLAL